MSSNYGNGNNPAMGSNMNQRSYFERNIINTWQQLRSDTGSASGYVTEISEGRIYLDPYLTHEPDDNGMPVYCLSDQLSGNFRPEGPTTLPLKDLSNTPTSRRGLENRCKRMNLDSENDFHRQILNKESLRDEIEKLRDKEAVVVPKRR